MTQPPPTKIMIFGRPGGGKSTFALKLHKHTGIPLHHIDKHLFESNWAERDYQEFLAILRSLIESASWIIDGNGLESLERRYSQADLVLYFNYPRWICYFRVLKRFLHKNPEIKDRAEGCKETLCFRLLHYMWNFENRVADQIKNFQARYPNTKFIEIKSDEDLEKLEDETLKA